MGQHQGDRMMGSSGQDCNLGEEGRVPSGGGGSEVREGRGGMLDSSELRLPGLQALELSLCPDPTAAGGLHAPLLL